MKRMYVVDEAVVDIAILFVWFAVACLYVIVKIWEVYKWVRGSCAMCALRRAGFGFAQRHVHTVDGKEDYGQSGR